MAATSRKQIHIRPLGANSMNIKDLLGVDQADARWAYALAYKKVYRDIISKPNQKDSLYREAIELLDEPIKLYPDFEDARLLRSDVWHLFLRDGNANYEEDYQTSDAWKEKSAEVLSRDGQTCVCGDYAILAHHKTYDNIGREPLSDLVALCKNCHDAYHNKETVEIRKKRKKRQTSEDPVTAEEWDEVDKSLQ